MSLSEAFHIVSIQQQGWISCIRLRSFCILCRFRRKEWRSGLCLWWLNLAMLSWDGWENYPSTKSLLFFFILPFGSEFSRNSHWLSLINEIPSSEKSSYSSEISVFQCHILHLAFSNYVTHLASVQFVFTKNVIHTPLWLKRRKNLPCEIVSAYPNYLFCHSSFSSFNVQNFTDEEVDAMAYASNVCELTLPAFRIRLIYYTCFLWMQTKLHGMLPCFHVMHKNWSHLVFFSIQEQQDVLLCIQISEWIYVKTDSLWMNEYIHSAK